MRGRSARLRSALFLVFSFLVSTAALTLIPGCASYRASLDESYYAIMGGDHEAAIAALKEELAEAEAREGTFSGKRKANDAYDNVKDRWTKVKQLALEYHQTARYEDVVSLYQRYIEKYPADLKLVKEYVRWYEGEFGPYPVTTGWVAPVEAFTLSLASAYAQMAVSYYAMNDLDRAHLYAKKVLRQFEEGSVQYRRAGVGYYVGTMNIFLEYGDEESADLVYAFVNEYREEIEKNPRQETSFWTSLIADTEENPYIGAMTTYQYSRGNYAEAERLARLGMKKVQDMWSRWRSHKQFGFIAETRGDVTIDQLLFIADCLYRQGKYDEAEEELEEYARGMEQWGGQAVDAPTTWSYDKLRGDIFRARGKRDRAIESYGRAVEKVEKLRAGFRQSRSKIVYAAGRSELYDSLITLLADRGDFARAFDYSEKARARAFLDLMAGRSIQSGDQGAQNLLDGMSEAESEIEEAVRRVSVDADSIDEGTVGKVRSAQREIERMEAELSQQYPEVASLVTVNSLSASEVRERIEEDVTLVEYHLLEDRLLIWVLDRDHFRGEEVAVPKERLRSLVRRSRTQLYRGEGGAISPACEELYDLLVEPVAGSLEKGGRLCVVPHGVLHYLPFQILHHDGRYLVEEYTVFYSPSASLYDLNRKKRVDKELTLFALGNPDTGDPRLDLPFAEEEVVSLKEQFRDAEVYVGSAATRDSFLSGAPSSRFVHIASHGVYNTHNPMRSGLLLAGDTEEESLLTAEQIFGIVLDAYQVTLSACETALGRRTEGDEVISLTRAFLYAGTPSVVSSLWSVNDEATAYLMTAYYGYLKEGDKASALRLAQLDTMKKYPDPFFWGAFVINGDWM